MLEKRTLEDVLADLKEAEKEYKEKCLKYGIEEKHKRKKADSNETNDEAIEGENSEENVIETSLDKEENSEDTTKEISEN